MACASHLGGERSNIRGGGVWCREAPPILSHIDRAVPRRTPAAPECLDNRLVQRPCNLWRKAGWVGREEAGGPGGSSQVG